MCYGTTLQDQLRNAVENIRRKPFPISDLIPLLQKAADRLDRLEFEAGLLHKHAPAVAINPLPFTPSLGEVFCAQVFNN